MWKYRQGFHRERKRKYPHRKFPFISPEFPQENYEEISTGMIPEFPQKSAYKSGGRGWLARWVYNTRQ